MQGKRPVVFLNYCKLFAQFLLALIVSTKSELTFFNIKSETTDAQFGDYVV